MEIKEENKILKIVLIVFLAIILGAGVGTGIYSLQKKKNAYQGEINSLKTQLDEKTAQCSNANKNANKNTNSGNETCASTLTAADRQNISNWLTYQNKTFSFKYPPTWQIQKDESAQITLHSNETDLNLNFYSGWAPAADADNYTESKEKAASTKVACVSTTKQKLFDSNNYQKLYIKFVKNEATYAVITTFRIEGASVTGDIEDAYDLILKTVEFK